MWATIWRFFATRAATGWALALGLALAGAAWQAYDYRGDKIRDLKAALKDCQGSPEQARIVDELRKAIDEHAQIESDKRAEDIRSLPNDCYYLDEPSPLSKLHSNEED